MIAAILYILLAIFLIIVLALLLPVKIFLKASGGDDMDIRANGRIMIFNGLLGGGGSYSAGSARFDVYLGGWRILERNAASIVRRARKKKPAPEKKKPEKPEEEKEPGECAPSLSDRIRKWRGMARRQAFLMKTVLHEIRGVLRVDRFSAGVKLGLGDPALTGQIIGVIYAVNGILPERYVIIPSWDFSRRVISGDVDIELTFRTYLFWMHLVRGFLAYRKFRREQRPVSGDDLIVQEV